MTERPAPAALLTPKIRKHWSGTKLSPKDLCRHRAGLIIDWVLSCYDAELAAGNRFCWYVVALAVGAGIYLVLPQEPSLLALGALSCAMSILLLIRRRSQESVFVLTVCMMLIVGITLGALNSQLALERSLDHERTVTVSGWIVDEETVVNGASRLTIKVAQMIGRKLASTSVPLTITVTFRAGAVTAPVGAGIQFLARLRPLQGPIMPGGYDFARRAFFEGRGAAGYALGHVASIDLGSPGWGVEMLAAISELRHQMSQRIRTGLPGVRGAIAAAIIVGETRGIPDAENDAIRSAGLPHMITIAGLHMSIVAGCVFFAIRWVLALFPSIALAYPIKAYAALGALAATTFYLMISGGHLSAERAYIMSSIMLLAVVFGRPALTMRNLGLAALVLIVRNPAEVVEPGFLMSFLAVMALIAAYQAWTTYRSSTPRAPNHAAGEPVPAFLNGILRHGTATVASTLIATVATASVTADQFYRVPPYGALSNMIVLPAIDLIAMPAAVLMCLAMPFGLESLPLTAMGWAIDFMDGVGFIAAGLPGGQGMIGRIHPWANPLAIAGLCWICLWSQSWRLLGLIAMLAALALAPFTQGPDLLISPDATVIAARNSDHRLKVLSAGQNKFVAANWLMADADPATPADPRVPMDPLISSGWNCDPIGCVFETKPGDAAGSHRIAVVFDPIGFDEDCGKADIIITKLVAPDFCRQQAAVFDHDSLAQTGAIAVNWLPAHFDTDQQLAMQGAGREVQSVPPTRHGPLPLQVIQALPIGNRPWVSRPIPKVLPPPVAQRVAGVAPPTSRSAMDVGVTSEATSDPLDIAEAQETLHPRSPPPHPAKPVSQRRVQPADDFLLDPTDFPDGPDD